jgi:hypothetical protein
VIKVSAGEGLLKVTSPYNKEFVSFARMRGGKWSDGQKVWMFDPRDEFAVRSVLIDIFGTDDFDSCPKVNVRVKLDHFRIGDEFVLFGRQLLRRRYADRRVDIADGVVVISGGFPPEGGSRRHPAISPEPGTTIEVRDVPRDIAMRAWTENKEAIELLGALDLEALKEEKEALLRRIEQIDQMIADLEAESERDELADLYD